MTFTVCALVADKHRTAQHWQPGLPSFQVGSPSSATRPQPAVTMLSAFAPLLHLLHLLLCPSLQLLGRANPSHRQPLVLALNTSRLPTLGYSARNERRESERERLCLRSRSEVVRSACCSCRALASCEPRGTEFSEPALLCARTRACPCQLSAGSGAPAASPASGTSGYARPGPEAKVPVLKPSLERLEKLAAEAGAPD